MMEDVRLGRINCIAVKDLSRLGRDYIEAGRLIQKIFPALHVRFIAVTDNYDSLTADEQEASLIIPVKNFVNDAYCRDISCKVRSCQKVKREKGAFIAAFSPYGYDKDEYDKNHLVLDAYASKIVRFIFDWRLEGMSAHAIAKKLEAMGVLSPMEYKRSKGENYTTGFAVHTGAKWSAAAIKRILANEMYTGTLVQGKSEKISCKRKQRRKKPKEEWIRAEKAHEPVVTVREFEWVQDMAASGSRALAGQEKPHMFSGFLFCGSCGQPMLRRINRYRETKKVYYICPTRNRGAGCSRHSILEEELKEAVLSAVRLLTALFTDREELTRYIRQLEVDQDGPVQFEREYLRLKKEADAYPAFQKRLQEDYKEGIFTKEDYQAFCSFYKERQAWLDEAAGKQEKMLPVLFHCAAAAQKRLEQLNDQPLPADLDRDVLLSFVRRIFIYEDNRIRIELQCRPMMIDMCLKAACNDER